jgi:hypothetical protein
MKSATIKTCLYSHPDGEGEVHFDAEEMALVVANKLDNSRSYVCIDPAGMVDLGLAIIYLGHDFGMKGRHK